jgi:hypothetical protein
MKQPDKNLPKQKQTAEQQKQQPKIERKVINQILAGIGSLPAIKAIGEKLNTKNKVENNENEALIAQKQQIIDVLSTSEQDNAIYEVNNLKLQIDELKRPAQKETKKVELTPEQTIQKLNSEFENNFKDLEQRLKNTTGQAERAKIAEEMNKSIEENAQKLDDIKQEVLDRSIEEQAQRTLESDHDEVVQSRAKNINSIRKERISNEKKADKEQKKGEKLTKKAEKSESDTIEYKKRVAELKSKNVAQEKKWDKEVETKKSKGSAFDRLKNTVGGAINKMKEQSKANVDARNEANKENNPNYKPNQHAAKAANRMKVAYNKIKDSMKVDHEKGPIIPQKLSELKSKIDNAKINRTDKAMEEGDKVISPELIKIRSALESKQIDIESTQREIKELSKELNSEKEEEYREGIQNDLDSLANLLEKLENEESDLKKQGISIFESQQNSKAFQAPEVKAQIEARNIAHNKIDRLQIERDLKTKPLNAKIGKLQGNKADKSDEIKKLQAKVSKIDQDFNKLIEAQQSIIQQN